MVVFGFVGGHGYDLALLIYNVLSCSDTHNKANLWKWYMYYKQVAHPKNNNTTHLKSSSNSNETRVTLYHWRFGLFILWLI